MLAQKYLTLVRYPMSPSNLSLALPPLSIIIHTYIYVIFRTDLNANWLYIRLQLRLATASKN